MGAVLTLAAPRTDDPLGGVTVPRASGKDPNRGKPSHLEEVHAELVSRLPVPDARGGSHHSMPRLLSSREVQAYIRTRTKAWRASRASGAAEVRDSGDTKGRTPLRGTH